MPTDCPAILQGYSAQCGDAQGGVQKFYITEHENIASFTEASGVLTNLTMVSGKKFWEYEQEIELAHGEEAVTVSRQTGTTFVDQTFTAVLHKRSASLSYALRALAHQNVAIISVEQTGTMFLYGKKNGMRLETGTSATGTAMGDRNGYELVFKGKEPIAAPTVSTDILAGVI